MTRSLKSLLALPILLTMASCGGDGGGAAHGGNTQLGTLQLDASFPVPFSYLSRVRELSDGTILAADPISQVLLRLDLEAGTADTIGRQGAGPQEYEGPDRVFPLPGDSTLLVDLGNGRLTVIDPEGTFVAWNPMTTTSNGEQARTIHPHALDATGNLYTTAAYFLPGAPDSTGLHRIDRASGEEIPVASSWHTEYVRRQRGAKRPMLVLHDDWAVGSDGRVVVVRANGYSVDWYFPDGTVINGPPNEVETFPVGEAEMEAVAENMAATGIMSRSLVSEDGIQSMQMARGIPADVMPARDGMEWPERLPVFRSSGTLVSPRGEAWVERFMPAGAPSRMDVFDDQGIRLGFFEIPPQSKVIGFVAGDNAGSMAYVARTDEVGLIWLERYRVVRAEDRR